MKRLLFFPLKPPHPKGLVHVLAIDDQEYRDYALTVWKTDDEPPYVAGGDAPSVIDTVSTPLPPPAVTILDYSDPDSTVAQRAAAINWHAESRLPCINTPLLYPY